MADKLHNVSSIVTDHARLGAAVWDRFSVTDPARQCWYYRSLAAVFEARLPDHPLTPRLSAAVTTMEHLTA